MVNINGSKETFYNYLKKHQSGFRWLLFFVNIIFLLFIIKLYISYGNIEQAIIQEKLETKNIQEHIYYLNNFKKRYLQSEYAPYLLGHENKRLFDKEIIIYFVNKAKRNETKQKNAKNDVKKIEPLDQRKKLIQQKMGYILQ